MELAFGVWGVVDKSKHNMGIESKEWAYVNV